MADIKVLIVGLEIIDANIDEISGFEVVGIGINRSEVFELLNRKKPDLVIINDCVPDLSNVELITFTRKEDLPIDFIIITAITNSTTIKWALRHGIFDYICKPFIIDRLKDSLLSYCEFRRKLTCKDALNQADFDKYKGKVPFPQSPNFT
ncbi:response regulator [Pelosinus fermentans]|uniref:Response regulatory domain-containing protein n=1 Tax=Pelosinus fermentans JBW45 TaxID=1192197 RepID=I8U2D8_9FIRM|nr:response regulator [Pelosinus fermentans]AJQ29845.1 response regulator receiver and unknown domain protein [Pelosinus fermentans JBW45]